MIRHDPVRGRPLSIDHPVTRLLLDCADLQLAHDFSRRHGLPVRHILLASLLALLHRHAELGTFTLSLNLSASFPSAFPRVSADLFPFRGAVNGTESFFQLIRSVASAESAAIASAPGPRQFKQDVIPYRLHIHWAPSSLDADLARTCILSIRPDEGLALSTPDGVAPHLAAVTLFRRLRPLLEGALADPQTPISRLPILTPAERHELLVAWNATERPLPPYSCAHRFFEIQTNVTPDAVAVTCRDQSLTYAELDSQANRLAHHLQSRGVGPDSIVALSLERSLDLVLAFLATLKAGGAPLLLDPATPSDSILAGASPSLLLTRLPLLPDLPDSPPPCRATPDNLCSLLHTPDGLIHIPHRSLINLLSTLIDTPGLSDRDVLLAASSPSSPLTLLDLLLPLSAGARLMLLPGDSDAPSLRHALESSHITLFQATPATWRMLLKSGWQGTPGLRMFSTGQTLTRDLARDLLSRGSELWNLYAPADTSLCSLLHRVDGDASPVPIGRPVPNTRCYILDPHLQLLPAGLTGELYLAGDSLPRPDSASDRFLPDPFPLRPDSRIYRTGDICRHRPDGQIEYLGSSAHPLRIHDDRMELSPSSPPTPQPLLIPLQTRGDRPPLFCLPGLGGHALSFRDLASQLSPDQPVYGLNLPPNVDTFPYPGRHVRAIAFRLLDEIHSIQPTGPYYLAGYAFGGLLAYEIAHLLQCRGESVALLALLDAFGPGFPHRYSLPRRLLRHAGRLLTGPPEGRGGYLSTRLRRLLGSAPQAAGAEEGYDYPPYIGRVALFRSTLVPDEVGRSFADFFNGWNAVVRSAIKVYPIPCGRFDLLRPPHVTQWGADLRDLLIRVQST